MYKIFKHRKLPCDTCMGETHIKLQWYNIFPLLFFLLQRNFFPRWLHHQTSTTKLCYLRSFAFYKAPFSYRLAARTCKKNNDVTNPWDTKSLSVNPLMFTTNSQMASH